jgi:hypothetical protein
MANAPIPSSRPSNPAPGAPPKPPGSGNPKTQEPTVTVLLSIAVYSHLEDIAKKGDQPRGALLVEVELPAVPTKGDVLGMLSMRDDKKLNFDTLINDLFDPTTIEEPELHVIEVARVITPRGFEKEVNGYKAVLQIKNLTERPDRLNKNPSKPAGDAVWEDIQKIFPGAKLIR